jgi:hypothetical protein
MKIGAVLEAWFLKEGGQISVSKMLATIASICGVVVAFQAQLVGLGITVPIALLPYFKVCAVVSALVAVIRVRNNQLGTADQAPTTGTPVSQAPATPPTTNDVP